MANLLEPAINCGEGGQVPALAVHRERIGSSCRYRLGTERMAQLVMPSRRYSAH